MADQKITELDELAAPPVTGDLVAIVDMGEAPDRTKNITIANLMTPMEIVVSDNLKYSADALQTQTGSSYVKKKEIKVRVNGTARMKFDLKRTESGGGDGVYGRIYINGDAIGTERNQTSTDYVTYSEDITVERNDLVQLYLKTGEESGPTANAINLRLYWDRAIVAEATVITD